MRTRKGGFRHLRRCNRELIAGPDFGGPVPNEPVYLPAYERYCGRFFDQLTRVSPNFWSEIRRSPVEVVFVSGFYGLLLWDELIQNYDCHLADYTRNGEERTVREIWGGVLTQAVRDKPQPHAISASYSDVRRRRRRAPFGSLRANAVDLFVGE